MAPCHAMGLREGVLREECAPQASPARGAPQHRLTKTSGEYVYPYLEGDERATAAVGRGTSFATPLTRLAALRTLFVPHGLSRGGSLSFADRRFATPPTALRLWAPPSYDAEGGTGPQLPRHPSASATPSHIALL